jgi:CHAT domain-containing protein
MPIFESPSVTYLLSENGGKPPDSAHVAFGSRTYDAFTNAELNTIHDLEPDIRMNSGPDVTRPAFLKALHESSLFYYAGHSVFDMKNAIQSEILLDGSRSGPNTVSASDIMQQRITRNATIILSSCETSLGNSIDGAGIGGLTSAFLVGGAGSVVGSIWPVESSSTMQLMSSAFEFLVRKHRSVVDSLQAAQIRLIHSSPFAHPYYWSGFMVTGNISAMSGR